MLKRRLIPKLLLRRSRHGTRMVLVATVRFAETIEVGDPVSQAKIYQAQAADELVFLDLDASREARPPAIEVLERAAAEVFMPITIGGGVRSVEDFRRLLAAGADKVAVNTAAVERPGLVREAADAFGNQCVVVSIDFVRAADGTARVYTRGGSVPTDLDPVSWAVRAEKLGAGEILLTSIARDGSRQGLDLETTRRVAEAATVPVVASGGCGVARHFAEGMVQGKADAVAAGTFFAFRDQNPMQARSHVRNAGIPIRLHT
ncbi:MAG: imidazole glycerol phosphate synthase subunit HisF [Methanobacteriota archaeon]